MAASIPFMRVLLTDATESGQSYHLSFQVNTFRYDNSGNLSRILTNDKSTDIHSQGVKPSCKMPDNDSSKAFSTT